MLYAGFLVPPGWTEASGQSILIDSNIELFAKLGTLYGGDGRTTFLLPDLTAVEPRSSNGQDLDYVICTQELPP